MLTSTSDLLADFEAMPVSRRKEGLVKRLGPIDEGRRDLHL